MSAHTPFDIRRVLNEAGLSTEGIIAWWDARMIPLGNRTPKQACREGDLEDVYDLAVEWRDA